MNNKIPFNWPHMTGKELYYIAEAHFNGSLAGDGPFTKKCHSYLEKLTGCHKALLTHSCTAALEMSALLIDVQPGDEIIMPSYTFVSTANAFVLRGGVPVFVDIRSDTLNIDEKLIERSITKKTKAIVVVHYAGVACEMDTIMQIAKKYELKVIEDAAQGMKSYYNGKALGSIGDIGAYSFHETKNIISGEGGALLVNDSHYTPRAEIIREKGTDRSSFFRGEVDKYTWQDIGSSFLPGELIAAFLWAQLEEADLITSQRLTSWKNYQKLLIPLESLDYISSPTIPKECIHNGHIFYVILSKKINRQKILSDFKTNNIGSVFHYVPLHTSPAGKRYGRYDQELSLTDDLSERLIRLPLWIGISVEEQEKIVKVLTESIKKNA